MSAGYWLFNNKPVGSHFLTTHGGALLIDFISPARNIDRLHAPCCGKSMTGVMNKERWKERERDGEKVGKRKGLLYKEEQLVLQLDDDMIQG